MEPAQIEEHVKRIDRDGYTIVENAIELETIDALVADLERIIREKNIKPGKNGFEGFKTVRAYNLLIFGKLWEAVPVHPSVLPIVEGVLDNGLLVSTLSSIAIGPGEAAQGIHSDDILIPLDKPHRAIICNTMWALTDFTDENGATRIVPGSHKYDHSPLYGKEYKTIPAEMKKGSVLIWHGSLWHGGGANRTTDQTRIGVAMNYCAGYIRQQENQQLGIPREIAAKFSPRLQELAGFGVYHGLIGHIEKHTPAERLFGSKERLQTIFERT
jgi:ectoine hydroxylase-related dioxygenase (phytanoyl-CoA dioxygenase family)